MVTITHSVISSRNNHTSKLLMTTFSKTLTNAMRLPFERQIQSSTSGRGCKNMLSTHIVISSRNNHGSKLLMTTFSKTSSLNFFIYCFACEGFRTSLKDLIRRTSTWRPIGKALSIFIKTRKVPGRCPWIHFFGFVWQ